MSCRRIRRELLAFVRFGELGPGTQPHLDHLAGCASCRDEVGYDREMVRRLRAALAARIEGMDPSPSVWEEIRRRAQAADPEPAGWLARLGAMAVRRRSTTAMAGTALALVLALNMEVVSVVPLPSPSAEAAQPNDGSPATSLRWARASTLAVVSPEAPERGSVADEPRTEIRMTGLVAGLVPPSTAAEPEPVAEVRVVFRTRASPEPLADDDRLGPIAPVREPQSEPDPPSDPSMPEEGRPS